jgi:nucleotide-binding universal stress UspA family protein
MHSTSLPSPGVVVGIDGSSWALNAALWATDEAVSRDVPLRLVYVIEPRSYDEFDAQQAARDLARADIAIRQALVAVESAEKPVKIEWEVVHGDPAAVLSNASRSADMVCVGSFGITHAIGDPQLGSTAAALSATASCPVAVIGSDCGPYTPAGRVVATIDGTPDSAHVLDIASGEAELRGAPLTILDTSQPTTDSDSGSATNFSDPQDNPIQLLIVGQHSNEARDVTCPMLICP